MAMRGRFVYGGIMRDNNTGARASDGSAPGPTDSLMKQTSKHDWRIAIALGFLAFFIFNLNGRVYDGPGDTTPAKFIPVALLTHGTVYLDPVRKLAVKRYERPYWALKNADGHYASLYP